MTEYTDNLRFALQENNENPDSWGDVLNESVIRLLEEALVGDADGSIIDVSLAGASLTLTVEDGNPSDANPTGVNKARCGILTLTGTLAEDLTITLPSAQGWYVMNASSPSFNDGGFSVTFQTGVSTNSVTLNQGDTAFFFTDADQLYPIIQTGGGGGAALLQINNLDDVQNKQQSISNLGVYPVGSIYMSTQNVNPATLFGGTWQEIGQGRVLMGVGESTPDENNDTKTVAAGETGGEYEHRLTINELAAHTHSETRHTFKIGDDFGPGDGIRSDNVITVDSGSTGGDQPHNNIMPYLGVYMWERIA